MLIQGLESQPACRGDNSGTDWSVGYLDVVFTWRGDAIGGESGWGRPPKDSPRLNSAPKDMPNLISSPKDIPSQNSPPKDIPSQNSPPKDMSSLSSPPKDISSLSSPPKDNLV
nr:hypothetical protein BgiMline_024459 [Biomphalaria glabrata]